MTTMQGSGTERRRSAYLVVLENTKKQRVRMVGYGESEEKCLENAFVKTCSRYPMDSTWQFVGWEDVSDGY